MHCLVTVWNALFNEVANAPSISNFYNVPNRIILSFALISKLQYFIILCCIYLVNVFLIKFHNICLALLY